VRSERSIDLVGSARLLRAGRDELTQGLMLGGAAHTLDLLARDFDSLPSQGSGESGRHLSTVVHCRAGEVEDDQIQFAQLPSSRERREIRSGLPAAVTLPIPSASVLRAPEGLHASCHGA
jgi:hypothetical protein